ncbi:protein NLRC5-like [Acanthaster planci]|uniref:Protein NLRC5-like n=1 Tax=Acanthaster planci TaxID=133434 RepID=A0A8B8A2T5_ACAPL|nr:protein NLRC5-like [Acanthaster planci]XP_022111276.1 protein NLRC5-like [Acanthaster planci]
MAEWDGGDSRKHAERKEQTSPTDDSEDSDEITPEKLHKALVKLQSGELEIPSDVNKTILENMMFTGLKSFGREDLVRELQGPTRTQDQFSLGLFSTKKESQKQPSRSPQQTPDSTTTPEQISDMMLETIADELSDISLQELVESLGLSFSEISALVSQFYVDDAIANGVVLYYWKRKYPHNQVDSLCAALEKLGRSDLAVQLREPPQREQSSLASPGEKSRNQACPSQEQTAEDATAEPQELTGGPEDTSDQSGQLSDLRPHTSELSTAGAAAKIREEPTDDILYGISLQCDPRKLPELATKLGFGPETVPVLHASFPNNVVDQIFHLLVNWRQKQPTDVYKLEALHQILASEEIFMPGDPLLMLQAQKPSGGPRSHSRTDEAADSCENALRTCYIGSCSYVGALPCALDDKQHMNTFTEVQLVGAAKGTVRLKETSLAPGSFSGTRLKSYEDIFLFKTKEGKPVLVAVVNGLHGTGKTTLFDKMAYDWACGVSETLRKYKLLFKLKMSVLEESSDLIEAVFDQLLEEEANIEKVALREYVKNDDKKVLVLLDGSDELVATKLDESSFGSVLKILSRKVFRGCTVLVSTRPSHFDRLVTKELVHEPFTHVRILGFSDANAVEYVHKFFKVNKEDAAKLARRKKDELAHVSVESAQAEGILERIRSSAVLSRLAKTPMLLLFVCLLWRENETLPETLTDMYKDTVDYIFKSKGIPEEEIANVVPDIGEVGLKHGLLSEDQGIFLRDGHFKQGVLDIALRAGILTKQRVLKKGLRTQNIVQFIHLTYRDFAAAEYLKNLWGVDVDEFQKALNQIMSKHVAGLEYLLRFCCGVNPACTPEILKQFQERFRDDLSFDSMRCQLALHCYFEGQSKFLPPKEFIDAVVTEDIVLDSRENDSDRLISMAYFLKRVSQHETGRGTRHLAKIQTLDFESLDLTVCVEDLAVAMKEMANLHTVRFERCALSEKAMGHISDSLVSVPYLEEMNISFNGCLGGTVASWCMEFKQFHKLRKLNMGHCSLHGEDIKAMAESVKDLPELDELKLNGNDLGGTGEQWCHVIQLPNLKTLDLTRCSLKGQDVKCVMETLTSLPVLAELNLSGNKEMAGTAASWCNHLRLLSHIEKLDLSDCSLKGGDAVHVLKAVGDLSLVELNLSGSDLAHTADQWYKRLQQLKKLQKLGLSNCSLKGRDIVYINGALKDLTNSLELNISSNSYLPGTGTRTSLGLRVEDTQDLTKMQRGIDLLFNMRDVCPWWCLSLQYLRSLRSLDMSGAWVSIHDMKNIVASLCDLPNFVEWNLSNNILLGGNADVWGPDLKQLPHIRKLHFRDCHLKGEDISHIVESLSCIPNLIELNLAGNNLSNASVWSQYLKRLINLKKLSLKYCSLEGDDVTRVAESLRDVPNLVALDLSSNFLNGTAASWVTQLKELRHLKKLNLAFSLLSYKDRRCIKDSLKALAEKNGLVVK